MNDSMIECTQLSKSYGNRSILNEISFQIPRGTVVGLLGKNGAGKTTLMKCLLGLMKASSGTVMTLGENPWVFSAAAKERIGYVPQSERVYSWLSVIELVNYTASFYQRWNHSLVDRLLNEWELSRDQKMGELSEGQLQMVMILLALGHEPELLILDEPVASLDPLSRRNFLKTLLNIINTRACTIVFSTHITSDLERVADRVVLLKRGTVSFYGETDDLKDTVKRLRGHSDRDLSALLPIPGIMHSEIQGAQALLTVRNFNEALITDLQARWSAQVSVEDLNLEEIFLELHR